MYSISERNNLKYPFSFFTAMYFCSYESSFLNALFISQLICTCVIGFVIKFCTSYLYPTPKNSLWDDTKRIIDFSSCLRMISTSSIPSIAGISISKKKIWNSSFKDSINCNGFVYFFITKSLPFFSAHIAIFITYITYLLLQHIFHLCFI